MKDVNFNYRTTAINGNEYYVYDTPSSKGKRKRLYAKSVDELAEKVEDYLSSLSDNVEQVPTTLAEAVSYINAVQGAGRKWEEYAMFTPWMLETQFANTPLSDLTAYLLTDFYVSLQSYFRKESVERVRRLLNLTFDFIVETYSYKTPFFVNKDYNTCFIPKGYENPEKRDFLTGEERSIILDEAGRKTISGENYYFVGKYAVPFILYTGITTKELSALKFSDFKEDGIHVTRSRERVYLGKGKSDILQDVECKKPRIIPYSRESKSIYQTLQSIRRLHAYTLLASTGDTRTEERISREDDYVFLTSQGRPVERLGIERCIDRILFNAYLYGGISYNALYASGEEYAQSHCATDMDSVIDLNTLPDDKKMQILAIIEG